MNYLMKLLSALLAYLRPINSKNSLSQKSPKVYITYKDWAMGRDVEYPPSTDIISNAANTLLKVNMLLKEAGLPFYGISSGYRPARFNKAAGGARRSTHLTGEAIDLRDRADQQIGKYLKAHPKLLKKHGLYMEDISYTKGVNTPWVHLQTRRTSRQVFIPY